jgi:cysteate synthase
MGDYLVRCAGCGSLLPPHALACPQDSALPRAEYAVKRLELKSLPGIWRFYEWLPVTGIIPQASEGSVTYKSEALAAELGLKNLYISFSGYWPECGARMTTCSFKDLEAPPTIQRMKERGDGATLVVASAGNTARAFAQVASIADQPLVLFVPQKALHRMWITEEMGPVTLISVKGDYYDAISAAEIAQSRLGFVPEGGARNIARRDGMGTVMLEAVLNIGQIPSHYFQAVGSGTGGISAWEAGMRLAKDGKFGSNLPRLHLAQNVPNAPIYYAWKGLEPQASSAEMFDDVLFNRRPPFGMAGGVKDALMATDGQVYGITDQEAADAKQLFEQSEEIDILNAPAVAVAALVQAVESGEVGPEDLILLNITGGGVSRVKEDFALFTLQPDITISQGEEAVEFLESRS